MPVPGGAWICALEPAAGHQESDCGFKALQHSALWHLLNTRGTCVSGQLSDAAQRLLQGCLLSVLRRRQLLKTSYHLRMLRHGVCTGACGSQDIEGPSLSDESSRDWKPAFPWSGCGTHGNVSCTMVFPEYSYSCLPGPAVQQKPSKGYQLTETLSTPCQDTSRMPWVPLSLT